MPPDHEPAHLPRDLPVPIDDGACLHLRHAPLPPIALPATGGGTVMLSDLSRAVLFFYPRTGIPGRPLPPGPGGESWDSIPGARGCTPQSCGFRDHYSDFRRLGLDVYGISTNTTDHQREFAHRADLPYTLLSDSRMELTRALSLPTFEFPVEPWSPSTLLRRMAWYIAPDWSGAPRIIRVWYPVFPPDTCASEVLGWAAARATIRIRRAASGDADFVRGTFVREWHGSHLWSRGVRYDLDQLTALVATLDGEPVGLLTYSVLPGGYQCEVVSLNALAPSRGVGAALLDEAVHAARASGCHRIFLTTSNDNLHAIAFYQRQGWRLCAVHRGSIDQARRWNSVVPHIAPNGIPIRDELELELPLDA